MGIEEKREQHAEDDCLTVDKKDCIEFDDFLQDELGGMSRYQLLSVYAITVQVFCAFTTTTLPFYLSATPKFRCAPLLSEDFINRHNISELLLETGVPTTPNQQYNSCHRRSYNFTPCIGNWNESCLRNQSDVPIVKCDIYDYDKDVYKSSIATEWNLVCDRTVLKTIANSSMFFGFLIGSIITGALTDRIGRKMTMLIVCLLPSASGFGFGLSQSYYAYVVFFVLYSIGIIGQYIVTYTYMSEISDQKQRGRLIFTVSLLGVFGDIAVSIVAYISRHWRYIAIYCGVINLFYIPIHFYISESPRWLLSVGREKKAREVVLKYFKSSGKKLNEDKWQSVLRSLNSNKQNVEKRKSYSLVDLFKLPRVRLISFNVMFSWIVISLVYYGLVLNIGHLAGNPYVNGIINSSLDIVATVVVIIAVNFCSKTYLFGGSFMIAGISCIGSMLVLQNGYTTASVVFAFIGRLGAASVYKVIYVLTPELFPTLLRGTGISLGSGAARFGAILSPFIVQTQDSIPWLMQTVFGTLSIIAGFLALLYPDTNNVVLASTPEEAEEFFKHNMAPLCRRRATNRRRKFTSPNIPTDSALNQKYQPKEEDLAEELI